MFHFPGCPPIRLCIHLMVTGHYPSRVPPFGNLRIKAYLQLPEAYRSLSRPSSAISAMASTLRSCSLDLASSRRSPPPKTIESGSRQKIVFVFVSSLCSFQGAVEVSLNFHSSILQNDTEINHFALSDSVSSLANFIDTLCRYCRSLNGLPVFPASCTPFLKCRPRI